jgi:hypothetical protein
MRKHESMDWKGDSGPEFQFLTPDPSKSSFRATGRVFVTDKYEVFARTLSPEDLTELERVNQVGHDTLWHAARPENRVRVPGCRGTRPFQAHRESAGLAAGSDETIGQSRLESAMYEIQWRMEDELASASDSDRGTSGTLWDRVADRPADGALSHTF